MKTVLTLQTQAIHAVQEQQWDIAVDKNAQIILLDPENISAYNRLGFCYIQQKEFQKAKSAYAEVITRDPYNTIAKKYLDVLEQQRPVSIPTVFCTETFIEEPGKTKTVQLCRIADPAQLLSVSIGLPCKMIAKPHRITIETESGLYLGSLPDDISHHLTRLLKGGNRYKVVVKAVGKTQCSVFIKELFRAKRLEHICSFPANANTQIIEIHEKLLIDTNVPVDMTETGEEDSTDEDRLE